MKQGFRAQRIAPAAINSVKDALTNIYWYKSELRSFLTFCLSDASILSRLNWQDYKRNIVSQLVDFLARHEDIYQRQLLRLMSEVLKIQDLTHLSRLEDGEAKVKRAKESLEALRKHMAGHQDILAREREIEQAREDAYQKRVKQDAVRKAIEEITKEYIGLLTADDPQARGYRLEKILHNLFELFDLDPKASFKVVGEQIDGAFTFENTDYLLEAKWQKDPVRSEDLDSLAGKLSRKLDNTLGLYLSINGYSPDSVQTHSQGRRLLLLMDGSDLMAVLEGRIDLVQLLLRKRRAAAQSGNIYLRIHELLNGSA